MLDLAFVIDEEGRDLTLQEKGAEGHYSQEPENYGEWVPGTQPAPRTIRGSLQPVSGKEFQNMPEGIRSEARAMLWTKEPIRSDDMIIDGADTYRVLSRDVWQEVGGYTKAVLGETS